jgi:hypothetical protein
MHTFANPACQHACGIAETSTASHLRPRMLCISVTKTLALADCSVGFVFVFVFFFCFCQQSFLTTYQFTLRQHTHQHADWLSYQCAGVCQAHLSPWLHTPDDDRELSAANTNKAALLKPCCLPDRHQSAQRAYISAMENLLWLHFSTCSWAVLRRPRTTTTNFGTASTNIP